MHPIFITYPQAAQAVQGHYTLWIVLLSCLVALVTAYSALAICERLNNACWRRPRLAWWLCGGGLLGVGIWGTHFTAMQSYRLPFPVTHDPWLTFASLLPALAAGLMAIQVLSRDDWSGAQRTLSACLLGLGVCATHYLGMSALEMHASLRYAPIPLGLSVVFAMGAAVAGVHGLHAGRPWPRRLGIGLRTLLGGALMAAAIDGTHYIAMEAAYFLPHAAQHELDPAHVGLLAGIVGSLSVLLGIAAMAAVLVDRRLQANAQNMRMSRRQLADIIESMHDGVVLLDSRARVVICNHAFETLTGIPHRDIQGHSLLRMNTILRVSHQRSDILRSLREHSAWVGDVEVRHLDAHRFPARLSINQVRPDGEDISHFVATLSDTSAHHDAQRRIHYQAYHDGLTGLPNRSSLRERIYALQLASGVSGRHIMLLVVDIDNFKGINDSLGQATGDRLLKAVAARLKPWGRQGDDLARLSSNEFALLYDGLSSSTDKANAQALDKARGVLESLNGDYSLAGERHTCAISGGFLVFHGDEVGGDELLKRVGLALLEAKCRQDQRPQAFAASMVERLNSRLRLERQLREAIRGGQLRLYLQPQFDNHRTIFGAEALVRWEHPERGLITPDAFIGLAEDTGQIIELGAWVLFHACETLALWQHDPVKRHWQLSVNVSVREFQRLEFVNAVEGMLKQSGAPAKRLTLELTESLMMGEAYPVIDTMTRLKALGVRFSIDDFGTGYSSLAYLKRLPLDALKIDVAFVRDLADEPTAAPIAQTIIALAHTLELQVIAEGVETEQQLQRLTELGCRQFQGYLFSPPRPRGEFLDDTARVSPPAAPFPPAPTSDHHD